MGHAFCWFETNSFRVRDRAALRAVLGRMDFGPDAIVKPDVENGRVRLVADTDDLDQDIVFPPIQGRSHLKHRVFKYRDGVEDRIARYARRAGIREDDYVYHQSKRAYVYEGDYSDVTTMSMKRFARHIAPLLVGDPMILLEGFTQGGSGVHLNMSRLAFTKHVILPGGTCVTETVSGRAARLPRSRTVVEPYVIPDRWRGNRIEGETHVDSTSFMARNCRDALDFARRHGIDIWFSGSTASRARKAHREACRIEDANLARLPTGACPVHLHDSNEIYRGIACDAARALSGAKALYDDCPDKQRRLDMIARLANDLLSISQTGQTIAIECVGRMPAYYYRSRVEASGNATTIREIYAAEKLDEETAHYARYCT